MNDDIVTRLRTKRMGIHTDELLEAADEIERLREQVAALNMVNWSYKEMVDKEYEDD